MVLKLKIFLFLAVDAILFSKVEQLCNIVEGKMRDISVKLFRVWNSGSGFFFQLSILVALLSPKQHYPANKKLG